jgi:hypothetical protein
LHWKLAVSLALRPKLADVLVVREPFAGPPLIDVVGPMLSIVQVREATLPKFPDASRAST